MVLSISAEERATQSSDPVQQCVDDLRQAVAAGSRDALERFAQAYTTDVGLREGILDSFDRNILTHDVIWRTERSFALRLSNETKTKWEVTIIEFVEGNSSEIFSIALRRSEAPGGDGGALKQKQIHELVASLIEELDRYYIIRETGHEMAALLRRSLDDGHYDSFTDKAGLALRLTRDVRSIYPDKHLKILAPEETEMRIRMEAAPEPGAEANHAMVIEPERDESEINAERHHAYTHHGIGSAWTKDVRDSVVAVLEMEAFRGAPEDVEALFNVLDGFGDIDALIVDVRGVPGHDGATVKVLTSTLSTERRLMGEIEWMNRETGEIEIEESWVTPNALSQQFSDVQVCVLIDKDTASAAEGFANAMQSMGRGVLIGEQTAGAGHMVETVRLVHGMGVQLPIGRSKRNSVEGDGLTPDVVCEPEQALARAMERVG